MKEFFEYKLLQLGDYSLTVTQLAVAIGILVVARLLLILVNLILKRTLNRTKIDSGRIHSTYKLIRYFVWVLAIVFCLQTLGAKINFIVASSAALFVGLGLGLQQIFRDFVSGLFMLFEGAVEVGDIMEVDGIVGRVKEINLRTCTLLTRDDIVIVIPNHKFIDDNVVNWSQVDERTRFTVSVGVAYGSDTALVKKALLESVNGIKHVEHSPTPFVRFEDFAESALIFNLYFWSKEAFRIDDVRSQLRFKIDKRFRELGITIAFPQRDIHIKTAPIMLQQSQPDGGKTGGKQGNQ